MRFFSHKELFTFIFVLAHQNISSHHSGRNLLHLWGVNQRGDLIFNVLGPILQDKYLLVLIIKDCSHRTKHALRTDVDKKRIQFHFQNPGTSSLNAIDIKEETIIKKVHFLHLHIKLRYQNRSIKD